MDIDKNSMADAMVLIKMDMLTKVVVEAIRKGELDFHDSQVQSCIVSNNMPAKLDLLEICAEHLTDAHKEYHVVMKFLDRIRKIHDDEINRNRAMNNIEVKK